MKIFPTLLASALLLPACGRCASDNGSTLESMIEFSSARRSALHAGSRAADEIGSRQFSGRFVGTTPLNPHDDLLVGFSVRVFEFSPSPGSLAPERLGSAAFTLGFNHRFDSPWSFRAEIDPGIYNDLGRHDDGFAAPAGFRFVYAESRTLLWVVGLAVDPRSAHPVVGGAGVIWKFAADWSLALVLPAPRLEWKIAESLTLFAGATLRGGTFRVADDFGRTRGRPELDHQIVDRELSASAGLRWQPAPSATLELGLGRVLDRRFEFGDRHLLLNGDGAPSAQLSLTSTF